MFYYVKGNLLESDAEALVNTVNTVGVMGKGIALQFKEAFPDNYKIYKEVCKRKELCIGKMLVTEETNLVLGHKIIINFPTKTRWNLPSEYAYIEQGLVALREVIVNRSIQSIAIPPLGSHNGGLDWLRVKKMIETALADLDCRIMLYEPSEQIIEKMKSERVNLTPARAMLLAMLADMNKNGEFASVFAAEKLVYFMQRFGAADLFKINFIPYYYGPYSGGKVAHVLYRLNGSYIKGMGGMNARPFDYIWLVDDAPDEANRYIDDNEDKRLRSICEKTQQFLQGYYSNYALELLSSVDFLLDTNPALNNWQNEDQDKVVDLLAQEMLLWSKRKEQLFTPELLDKAVVYLKQHQARFDRI